MTPGLDVSEADLQTLVPRLWSAAVAPQPMIASWDEPALGVVRLPSWRLVRGRGLWHPIPTGLEPTLGLYLLGRWRDFCLPADRLAAKVMLAHQVPQPGKQFLPVGPIGASECTDTYRFEAVHCSAPVSLMHLREVTGCRWRCGEAESPVILVDAVK
jgi:hypothetical protein